MKRKNSMGNRLYKNVMIGALVGIVLMILGALLGAYLLYKEIVGIHGVGYISVIVLLMAAFLGSTIGGKGTVGKERLLSGAVTGAVMLVFLLVCNLAIFGGEFYGVLVTGVLILACSLCAFLLFGKPASKKKFKIPKL